MPLYYAGARVKTYYPVSIVTHGLALNITVVSYSGAIDFGITACRRAMPDIDGFVDDMRTAYDELKGAIERHLRKAADESAAAQAAVPGSAPSAGPAPRPAPAHLPVPAPARPRLVVVGASGPAGPSRGGGRTRGRTRAAAAAAKAPARSRSKPVGARARPSASSAPSDKKPAGTR
jgi:hypothetical protein